MKLPNVELAVVPRKKITDYLLSPTHWHGRWKETFFSRYGFSADSWETLALMLKRHAIEHKVCKVEKSPFGTRYIVEGIMATPLHKTPLVRSVWFIENGEHIPRFVTAYPLKRRGR